MLTLYVWAWLWAFHGVFATLKVEMGTIKVRPSQELRHPARKQHHTRARTQSLVHGRWEPWARAAFARVASGASRCWSAPGRPGGTLLHSKPGSQLRCVPATAPHPQQGAAVRVCVF